MPLLRARVGATLDAWGVPGDLAHTLLLAVAELAGNAVRHAAPATDRLRVTVAIGGGRLRVEVEDGDPTLPPMARPTPPGTLPDTGPDVGVEARPDAESGRGLLIVGLLVAEACGRLTAHTQPFGKRLRVCVPTAHRPVTGPRGQVRASTSSASAAARAGSPGPAGPPGSDM
ncbi:ATP-binding protein [Streptomyces sp. NPDC093225]|uniref:ATP-binding protein n=1 Tax=Streptomyces sp. NPDC093225 TaxID=3366034 RepID=UPI0038185467